MKLLDLTIENYGIYSARHFDFSGPGFRLIYGPNEAGKSTLLQLIREVLFGFPHVSPYVFENHTGKLAATVRMEMQNGRRVRFRRQKGSKNTVTGEVEATRQPVNDGSLNELLGRAGGELFEHVFGFSLTELTAGEKSLQHANLTEALYGSGVGGLAGFQRLQRSLLDEHQKLFSPRARKPIVNRLLTSISEQSQQLRESLIRPREYQDLQETLDASTARAESLSGQIESLRLEERRLERWESALDTWSRCIALREEIARLADPCKLPADAADRFRQVRERRDEARKELNQLEASLALMPVSPTTDATGRQETSFCSDEALARQLFQDVGRIRDCIKRVPRLLEDAENTRQTLLVRVQQLNPEWSIDDISRFHATEPQRELIRELESEWNELLQLETSLSSRRPELQRQLDVTRRRLEVLTTQSREILPALEDLIDRSTAWTANRGRMSERQAEVVRVNGELDALANRLQSMYSPTDTFGSPSDELRTLVLPLPAEVEAARARQNALTLDTRRAGEQLQERQQELQEAERQLREQEASQSVVTVEALKTARGERDISWKLIRRQQTEGTRDNRLMPSPDDFERSMAAADSLADKRFANAELVARREHLVGAVDTARERVEAAQAQLQQRCAVCEAAEAQWRDLWPVGVQAGSPDAMLDWLRLHADLVAAAQRQEELDADVTRLGAAIDAFEVELIRALQTPLQSPDASLAQARELCERHRRDRMEQERLSAELP